MGLDVKANRTQMRVETDDGSVELFVVSRVEDVQEQIASAAARAR
jgi:hypothetical protein